MTSQRSSSDMTVRRLGTITIVEFLDRRLIDTARIEALGSQVMELVNSNPSAPGAALRLIISFEKVEYLSSTMLNVLIGLDNAVKKAKGQLVLANLDPELHKVFKLMKLDKVMKICKTTDEALSALKN